MLPVRDNLGLALDAIRAHKLRASLTILGLTMGVATLISVVTIIQGANVYVEQKIANLGVDVFRISRMPFVVTDFSTLLKARRNKRLTLEDMEAIARRCGACEAIGASLSSTTRARYRDQELVDVRLIGQTASMVDIDTRTLEQGRYFTPVEDQHGARVCVIGARIAEELFPGIDPIGRALRAGNTEFRVIGIFEEIGTILGQDQDNFLIIPMGAFRRMLGTRRSIVIEVKAAAGGAVFQQAIDEARWVLRARRHIGPKQEEDFFIGTASSYMSLWESISTAFFAVFIMVSAISAIVGGIVIMNVMLVSVTERTKEIGIRRASGATRNDILRQFLAESVLQCLLCGALGILAGFAAAITLETFTEFPASVQTGVAVLGVVLSSSIGLFFGIYPAVRAARLDPVVALRSE